MLQGSRRILAGVVIVFSALFGSITNAAEAGGEYTLSKQYGSVFFKVLFQQTLMMVGRFDDYSGTLSLDPANLANSKLTASVNMTSLNMADKDVAETLVTSSSWFDTTVFSSATFTSTSVTVTGENTADFQGDLKFMGITKPWTLHVQFFGGTDGELDGSSVGIQGTGTINRLDFGLDEYQEMAASDVAIEVNVKFNRN